MSHCYAQINEAAICMAVTEASGPIDAPHMIPLDSFDMSVLGKTWQGESSTWVETPIEPE